MTQIMLNVIRTEETRVHMELYERDGQDSNLPPRLVECRGGRWMPKPNTFVYLRTRITNLSREHAQNHYLSSPLTRLSQR